MKIENRTELKEYRAECQKKQSADCRVLVCGGPGCLASGSQKIYEKFKELTKENAGVEVNDRAAGIVKGAHVEEVAAFGPDPVADRRIDADRPGHHEDQHR